MRPPVRLLTVVLAAALVATASVAATADTTGGLAEVSRTQLSARLWEVVVRSQALGREATVRVQLPTGYGDPTRRWPLALLLHGRSEDATTWSERTDLEQFDGMVIVTPEGGRVGWYTDWFDDACCDTQRWESFHLDEVLPWAERAFRLAPGRSQRFVAGDSMGGFGAMSYAARHPDRFGGAAEFSGFVDLMLLESSGVIGVDGQSFQVAGVPPGSIFGPKETEEVRWRGANPVDLAANLAWTDLVLRHGNGLPGRFGGDPDAGEAAIRLTGLSLHDRLAELGIDHVWDDYGNGVHTWPYWEWGLQVTWPRWQAIAEAAAPDPVPFSYRSIAPSWSVYGWEVAFDRGVLEFAELSGVSAGGFTLTGTGTARVTTAPWFAPRSAYRVTGLDGTGSSAEVAADEHGRLSFTVDLGPPNEAQQFTPPAEAAQLLAGDDYFRTVHVTLDLADPVPTAQPGPAEDERPAGPLPATGGSPGLAALGVSLLLASRSVKRG